MNYRKYLISLMLLVGVQGCVGVAPNGMGYNITVPMNIINSTVGQNFPRSENTGYGTLRINRPNILARQGSDKLSVGASFKFSNMLIPNGVLGSVSFSGGIRYNPRNSSLYLTSPMIDELKFQNFSLSAYLTPQMRNNIGNIIAQQLMNQPIYRLNNIGASFVRGINVSHGNIVVTVGL